MVGSGKVIGLVFGAIGLAIIGLGGLWLASNIAEGKLQLGAAALGLGLVSILGLALLGTGGFLVIQGRREAVEYAEVEKQRKLLNMVQTAGKMKVSDLALELKLTRDQVKNAIYDLVGKGLFTGYINWNDGILYARGSSEMRTTKCPNCGGEREMVGQGIVKCPYCGSELFL